ncbi:unnamed protein product [Moneuplotes crassus]|uniref:Dynein light chain n=1 Tax=Euplotes crassus TaxID=5936 RepID=A0AAD1Y204_EUPCR|nr:unnamed protein product [Moneuplotes crassus]
MEEKKIRIESSEMSKDMINVAIQVVRKFEKAKTEKDMAIDIKREFDLQFFPTWQCIVGKSFGSEIGFEEENMLYFYWGEYAILLWKAG